MSLSKDAKGVGRYAFELIYGLDKTLAAEWDIDVYVNKAYVDRGWTSRVGWIDIEQRSELYRGLIQVPALVRKKAYDALLYTSDSIFYGNKRVERFMILHDLNEVISHHQKPVGFRRKAINRFVQKMRVRGMKQASHIFCVSSWVQEKSIEHYGLLRCKTSQAACGIDEIFFVSQAGSWAPYTQCGYVLAIATGDDREGLQRLPAIWKRVKNELSEKVLVVGGIRNGERYVDELKKSFDSEGLNEGKDYVLVSFIDQENRHRMADLYANADFYIELSSHEGFGLQALEAMATGTTCLSTGKGAMEELGGGYPISIDAGNDIETANTILRSYMMRLEDRDNEEQVGFVRRYSWDNTVDIVRKEIEKIVAGQE